MTRQSRLLCSGGDARGAFLAVALLALGCSGKGVARVCADITPCGGDPTGKWEADSVCQASTEDQPLSQAPMNSRLLTPQSPVLDTSTPPAPNSAGDWCSGLVYIPPELAQGANPIRGINFYAPALQFDQGSVLLGADHTYSITASVSSPEVTHFSRACINAYGANPTCKQLEVDLAATPNPNYQNLVCVDAADRGCDCSYEIEGTGSDTGNWQVVGSTIYQYSFSSGKPPQLADFCVSPDGQHLTLGGPNGAQITGANGLRSMVLHKVGDGT